MKKIHIVGIVVIAVAIGVIFTSLKNPATYADFNEALANPDKEYHVVGELNKTQPLIYDPKINPDEFIFTLVDNKGIERLRERPSYQLLCRSCEGRGNVRLGCDHHGAF